MNSAHDLGGMMGFGPVDTSDQNINFHEEWEARIFALTLAAGATGCWNIDKSRHARESLNPAQYLSSSYYQIWLAGLEKLLLAADLVSSNELADGGRREPPKPVANILKSGDVLNVMMRGSSYERDAVNEPAYKTGDMVLTKNMHPEGHTRIPRYVRNKPGTIERIHGCHVFPDSNAHDNGENPQWLYRVRFSARDIWGEDHPARDSIFVDLWETYLEPR